MDARLTVVADGIRRGIVMNRVRRIDEAGPVTPLPFTEAPVEGVATVDGRPVLQLNLAQALGQSARPGGKVVVVAVTGVPVALRVDAVHAEEPGEGADAAALDLEQLVAKALPGAQIERRALTAGGGEEAAPGAARRHIALLMVSVGDEVLAFPAERVERVGRVESLRSLPGRDDGHHALASVEGELLPARRLVAAGSTDGADTWAVIVA
ncbi:MAG TPA: chemotaxis protein CheW, partial [Azospirillaceae bacterium]|nr:chemotaxis protein CheW [Azospirillaceae bacterium]